MNIFFETLLDFIPQHLLAVMRALENRDASDQFPAVSVRFAVVGGLVRDGLLAGSGDPDALAWIPVPGMDDLDMVVQGLEVEHLLAALHAAGLRAEVTGVDFPVVRVMDLSMDIQIALARTERSLGDSHTSFEVNTAGVSLGDDLLRRDSRVNAMAVLLDGRLLDPCGGLVDLYARVIDTPLDPDQTVADDPLRPLRFARQAGALGFTVSPRLMEAMVANAPRLAHLPVERIFMEFEKMAAKPGWSRGLRIMAETGLLAQVLPEWAACVGFDQRNPHHDQTVDQHILAVCDAADAMGHTGLLVMFACLLHDIGKPQSFSLSPKGRGSFHGHEDVGADLARKALRRLKAPVALTDAVALLVSLHMRLVSDCGGSALRRLAHALGGHVDAFAALATADRCAHVGGLSSDHALRIAALRDAAAALASPGRRLSDHTLALSGSEITRLTGRQGREIGQAKQALLALVVDGYVPNERAALEAALRSL